ncbi:MAG: cytochrome C [Candidatus Zixiibacteriota bacterium]|nr:MAG: cytochrome C [candidate division Zixibacteria bacterium]
MLYNRVSFLGGFLAAVVFVLIILTIFFSWLSGGQSPYFGLVAFLILPPFLVLGLILIPVGAVLERRRRIRTGRRTEALFPVIDLNNPKSRWHLTVFNIGLFAFLLVSALGTFQAYHYTETTEFCGTLCHQVMEPEHTAYTHSPHARVECVECHVGPGAGFFVRSKLSGLYQVYATLTNIYPRPIPTPIENLRPAQETCEQCHWPTAFFGKKQRLWTHHLYDEESTPWRINMLIKIGGGSPATAQTAGIHWHMNIANRIEFIATDSANQDIPWVRFTDLATGQSQIFIDENNPPDSNLVNSQPLHVMDCIDCHNRPTHIFDPPDRSVDLALNTRRLDPRLPGIKELGVNVLAQEYETTGQAMDAIAAAVSEAYETLPDSVAPPPVVEQAISTLQGIYSTYHFPVMNTRWDTHHNHIGHSIDRGCFRCHDGHHVAETGNRIKRDCTSCHAILAQGPPDSLMTADDPETGLEFVHPVDIGEAWREIGCYECHTGAEP